MADEATGTPGAEATAGAVDTAAQTAAPSEQVQTPGENPSQQPGADGAQTGSELVSPPEDKSTVVGSEPDDSGVVTYNPTGDAALDVALAFMGNLGIQGDDPAMNAAKGGNFSLLEAKLATMGEKSQGWQQMVNLAKDAYERNTKAVNERVAKTDQAILAVVGSKENWSSIKAWAAQNATPEEKAEINSMIDGGPVQARAAANMLLMAYTKATGTSVTPANPAKDAGGQPVVNSGQLNAREYTLAVADLRRKLGTNMESSSEYRALQARLAAK